MTDCVELRARATRIFALAVAAREAGATFYADELVRLANEILAKAEIIERSADDDRQR
jgi:hypothetical protein